MSSASQSSRLFERTAQAAILLAGLILPQFILYGPSLIGRKLLLPLDCLAAPGWYLPPRLARDIVPGNMLLSDAVLQTEPDRVFAAREVRRGQLPLWNPYNYCGVPFLANNNSAVFSPFMLPSYVWPGPEVLAWTQMLKALVAGIGAFCFFRRVLGAGYWPAAIGAWCYPHTGYLVLWGWIHHSGVVCWLPWMLLTTAAAVRRPSAWGGPGLAMATALTVFSGKIDTSAQVLFASGLFAVWCLVDRHGWRGVFSRRVGTAHHELRSSGGHSPPYAKSDRPTNKPLYSLAALSGGWVVGLALAAPVLLPTYEYLQSSTRVEIRRQGHVDFEPSGWAALPQVVLPYVYGSHRSGSRYLVSGNHLESAAVAYAGLLATLVLAPAGWTRRLRSINGFWCLAGAFALVPQLGVPLIREVYRLPGLNLLQNNRFAFFTGWCLLAMAVAGLDVLWKREFAWRRWHEGAWVLAALIGLGCAARAMWLPESVVSQAPSSTHAWFRQMYAAGAVLGAIAAGAWLLLRVQRVPPRGVAAIVGALALAELVYNAYGSLPQTSPALDYPKVEVLERLAAAPAGRICGARASETAPRFCLPANMARVHGLPDIRGYDGADPSGLVRLLEIANPRWEKVPHFAVTQGFQPVNSAILDMLNLRYRVFRGKPPEGADVWLAADDYWVLDSGTALPRPFVPSSVEVVTDQEAALAAVARADFDPRGVAYVDEAVDLPTAGQRGTARIAAESPGDITIDVDMETAGLIVLADLWCAGWQGSLKGEPAALVRTNGVLRGVVVPAGRGTLHLEYRPGSFAWGLRIGTAAMIAILTWTFFVGRRSRRRLTE